MLRCATTSETAVLQGFRGIRCRGEDSNLCSVAKHDLTVGHPLRLESNGHSHRPVLKKTFDAKPHSHWPVLQRPKSATGKAA